MDSFCLMAGVFWNKLGFEEVKVLSKKVLAFNGCSFGARDCRTDGLQVERLTVVRLRR